MYLGARDLSHQWEFTLIHQEMVFAAKFAAVDFGQCVRPRQVPVRLQRQRKLGPT